MIYLTKEYITKEFETKEDALNYIKDDLERHNLSYNLIFQQIEDDIEVYIYQYKTLYMEAYILHKEFDLRERNYIYE